ncbi:hypothetical protein [Saccharopolyspora hattusasensis]|uniref:hypothetical protein n=1 Tax=Saccharopolyspora hattusasensis TaxID=1128679 RepID=UPI003D97BECC
MTPADPRAWFPAFYDNPAIRALATACRWTISGRLGELDPDDEDSGRKAPIDVRHLINGCNPGCRHIGPLRGAFALDDTCLLTLDELTAALPNAANAAYYLQSQIDGLVVIDIESDCPPWIATDLLRLPGILYSELSMSGRGFHLVLLIPQNFHDFPVAAGKRVLQEEHGWYEILLDHWCTFTRTPVPDRIVDRVAAVSGPAQFASIEELYAELAAKVRPSANISATAVGTGGEMPDIAHADRIVEQTLAASRDRMRSPEHFGHDLSRWEFSILGTLYHGMQTSLRTYRTLGMEYSAGDQAWLLYRAALDVIPSRQKHGQLRNSRPFLLDRAAALVAEREAAEARA